MLQMPSWQQMDSGVSFSCVNLARLGLFFLRMRCPVWLQVKIGQKPNWKKEEAKQQWLLLVGSVQQCQGHSLPLLSSTPRPALLPDSWPQAHLQSLVADPPTWWCTEAGVCDLESRLSGWTCLASRIGASFSETPDSFLDLHFPQLHLQQCKVPLLY